MQRFFSSLSKQIANCGTTEKSVSLLPAGDNCFLGQNNYVVAQALSPFL